MKPTTYPIDHVSTVEKIKQIIAVVPGLQVAATMKPRPPRAAADGR